MNSSVLVDKTSLKYADKIKKLSLAEKVELLSGKSAFTLHGNASIGLQPLVFSDGPTGVRGLKALNGDKVALLPNATLIASAWDDDVAREVGEILSEEAWRQGVDVVLGPTINLHRTPLGGRLFEAYSEDPYLTGRTATAYVQGMQDNGTGACLKHLVANESETLRNFVNSVVDESTLRELYLLPFEMVVKDANAWSIMSGYNDVNGLPASSQDKIKNTIVKGEWRWDGLIMSDWYATKSTVASVNGGLDLVMPGPGGPWKQRLISAVESGAVLESTVDEHVSRLLLLADRAGKLDSDTRIGPLDSCLAPDSDQRRQQLRRIASRGMTLLYNNDVLPLNNALSKADKKISLIGRHAIDTVCMGGGSAKVNPPYQISLADALAQQLETEPAIVDGVEVRERPLPADTQYISDPQSGQPGMRVVFLDENDEVMRSWSEDSAAITLEREDGVKEFPHRITFEARLSNTCSDWEVGGIGAGSWTITIDDESYSENLSYKSFDPGESVICPASTTRLYTQVGGKVLKATLELNVIDWRHELEQKLNISIPDESHMFEMTSQGLFALAATPRRHTDDEALIAAEESARATDVAIVMVGLTDEAETEGTDKETLSLPGRQNEMVARVANVAKKTIVIVNAATPVLMPWADDVDAILIAGLPGQEGGHAIADVIVGRSEPTGRLVTCYPIEDGASPAWSVQPDDNLNLVYEEKSCIGYRGYDKEISPAPLYWFGSGLGYGVWNYEKVKLCSYIPGSECVLEVTLSNTGAMDSRETVQVYFRPEDNDQPIRLVGYQGVDVSAGHQETVSIKCDPRLFNFWDVSTGQWNILAQGELIIARGLGDKRLRIALT
ncbi:beta-glucosidase [Cobetia marina]|uniref:beta-glucosidase n=1 Tax=Cobetia marina TaxID=28258 RepID=UPI001144C00B|nr:glycoside hydrolase family 3 C-terminal domain-containing protein [Cobetia marina]GED40788.1 glycosyl hydrolase [Cobetia marina]